MPTGCSFYFRQSHLGRLEQGAALLLGCRWDGILDGLQRLLLGRERQLLHRWLPRLCRVGCHHIQQPLPNQDAQ